MSPTAKSRKPESGTAATGGPRAVAPSLIAAGLDGYPEGRDAAALGAAIAHATGAELMLVAVQSEPLVVLPQAVNRTSLREDARRELRESRDALAPDARTQVETDVSVARALQRVVEREHRDLLVVGSSRRAGDGRVRIGKRTRQLLSHSDCPLAIAPRGLHTQPVGSFDRIGVGYDGGPESDFALSFAAALAIAAGAELHVRSAVDDRMPAMGWGHGWPGDMKAEWRDLLAIETEKLRKKALAAGNRTGATNVTADAIAGRPADTLLALAEELDMLVIGSRRWGPAARVLLGSTGEAVLHGAPCPVIAVPRPRAEGPESQ